MEKPKTNKILIYVAIITTTILIAVIVIMSQGSGPLFKGSLTDSDLSDTGIESDTITIEVQALESRLADINKSATASLADFDNRINTMQSNGVLMKEILFDIYAIIDTNDLVARDSDLYNKIMDINYAWSDTRDSDSETRTR